MIIKSLELAHFRNVTKQKLQLHPSVNVFLGDNGQGKTNILEALYLICTGQSFRAGTVNTLIQENQPLSLVKARLSRNNMDSDLRVILENNKRVISRDGKRVSALSLAKVQGAVLFSPESLSSIKDGAEQRRRLVDELIGSYDVAAIQTLQDFQKQLRSRNRILKKIASNDEAHKLVELEAILEALNPQYFSVGQKLTQLRRDALREIQPDFQLAMRSISDLDVDIAVEYVVSEREMSGTSFPELSAWMSKRADQLAVAEKASGVSLTGPQKHDIRILYNGKDSRYYCSQGQQRALILAFKMAQIVYHRKVHGVFPVLMLDDVLSELDKQKREKLVDFLASVDTQIFITTTDFGLPSSLSTEEFTVFQVKQGRVTSDR